MLVSGMELSATREMHNDFAFVNTSAAQEQGWNISMGPRSRTFLQKSASGFFT